MDQAIARIEQSSLINSRARLPNPTLENDSVEKWSSFRFLRDFDNQGIFHLIQMVGLLIISMGLVRSQEPLANAVISDGR